VAQAAPAGLRAATYEEAKTALKEIRRDLAERNLSAVGSLDEGLEETLTLHRLGVFPLVGISLKTTNCLESIFSQVETRTGRVCHWKNSSQKHRWLAAALLDLEPQPPAHPRLPAPAAVARGHPAGTQQARRGNSRSRRTRGKGGGMTNRREPRNFN